MANAVKHPLVRADAARSVEKVFNHPLNPESEAHVQQLSDLAGLKRIGVRLVRVPPGVLEQKLD
jgi:uncharacterized cupin superfamily protein